MLNINLLNDRYGTFIPEKDSDTFAKEVTEIKNSLNLELINELKPLLIYSRNKRNELLYLMGITYSLIKKRVLNYTVITGATFTRQHFATSSERDHELQDDTYYGDLLYILLSQNDYGSEYMENLIIDLIDFRHQQGKVTVVIYDTNGSTKNPLTVTQKLNSYFANNKHTIQELTPITTQHSAVKGSQKHNLANTTKANKRRIV